MLIDWFTVIAQVLNFLILVWLLKRFLYKPILHAVDAREKKVADELANADAKEREARKEKEEFRRKNEEFDQQHVALLNKVKEEAKVERQRLFEEARKEASDLKVKQLETLRNDKKNLNQIIIRRTQQEVFGIARKVLKDLAGMSLEERIIEVFIQRLRELKDWEKEQLLSALGKSPEPILIHTAFDLSQKQSDLVREAIKQTLGIETQVGFKTTPDLVGGIELIADGQKVAWSVADYLSSLERSIDEVLKDKQESETKIRSESKLENSRLKSDQTIPKESKPEPLSEQQITPNPSSRGRVDKHGI